MAIRVVARIRPQRQEELAKDIIVSTASAINESAVVRIPNPKNESELFTFQFSSVYDALATQQQIFDNEVSPTIKHLFNGFDVTIFAYGSTGTGKTHTMRGGRTLAERGIIPRLLSSIYRKARKVNKDSEGMTSIDISLSYYEIYNDKVFDLFEAPEKRTPAGLPLRDNGGKIVVVGLTERPCKSLKEFEDLYDKANVNRSTGATKLNAVSSRSHAVLGIKLAVTTGNEIRISTASAIDLAGSEDNRRTENRKERMVESASINKSLFVLAKCVEAISSDSARIPYRESKMTRILCLGQNNSLTIMVLNLAPVRSYHFDTLSSLNFANRTKRIEIREIENEPIFKGCSRSMPSFCGKTIDRQPLRPLATSVHNSSISIANGHPKPVDKQAKAFAVYSDRAKHSSIAGQVAITDTATRLSSRKRPLDTCSHPVFRPPKKWNSERLGSQPQVAISTQAIEDLIHKKVEDVLAARALSQTSIIQQPEIREEVQRRLDLLEQRFDGRDDGGLTFLLMAKQYTVRGEDTSALRMYTLAKDFFPNNRKLDFKMKKLREKIRGKKEHVEWEDMDRSACSIRIPHVQRGEKMQSVISDDEVYREKATESHDSDCEIGIKQCPTLKRLRSKPAQSDLGKMESEDMKTPRTRQLLTIINTRDISHTRTLRGVGIKKAKVIVDAIRAAEEDNEATMTVHCLEQLCEMWRISARTIEVMRLSLGTAST